MFATIAATLASGPLAIAAALILNFTALRGFPTLYLLALPLIVIDFLAALLLRLLRRHQVRPLPTLSNLFVGFLVGAVAGIAMLWMWATPMPSLWLIAAPLSLVYLGMAAVRFWRELRHQLADQVEARPQGEPAP